MVGADMLDQFDTRKSGPQLVDGRGHGRCNRSLDPRIAERGRERHAKPANLFGLRRLTDGFHQREGVAGVGSRTNGEQQGGIVDGTGNRAHVGERRGCARRPHRDA